jgi:hypothetical protein
MSHSLKILLSEIIDYAGLFPPSQVTMQTAVQNFAKYLKSKNAWMLGRFVVPIDRLDEFSAEVDKVLTKKNPWRLSVLAGDNLPKTLRTIAEFNLMYEGKITIDALEIKVETADKITETAKLLPEEMVAYFEFPPNDILSDFVTALALTHQRAKIRTGGVTQDAFPSTDAIIKFMRICIAANVPFKATAGLHHPLRCTKPLTYEENAPIGTMHGFLNLFLSAAFLRQDLNNPAVHKLINETDPDNFSFNEEKIGWTDRSISTQTVALTRQRNAISFGSCSFVEPIEDLISLGIYH